jgi:RNA polymerase sigma-70 factor (ECF subfamily)
MPPLPSRLDLANLPDADVVRLAQDGREAAFRELVRRYERPVFSLVFRMVRDRETAEDLAQDSFIKVLNHIDKYSPEFKFSSWLFKIANNVAIDHLRRKRLDTVSMDGSPHASTRDEVEATTMQLAAEQESALEELEARELGTAIERAIARLRPEYRNCIMLRHVEGRSYERSPRRSTCPSAPSRRTSTARATSCGGPWSICAARRGASEPRAPARRVRPNNR